MAFTQEQIDKANNTSIEDVMNGYGLSLIKRNKSYVTDRHDSLNVEPDKNVFKWYSRNIGGGPIQFVMAYEGCDWKTAINKLIGNDEYSHIPKKSHSTKKVNEETRNLILPKKSNTYKHLYAYLNSRGIKKSIIDLFVKNKLLYESVHEVNGKEYNNITFVGYDSINNPRYAASRSANTFLSFKGEAPGSCKEYAVNLKGQDNELYIFESGIEMMSFLSLIKDGEKFKSHLLAAGGTSLVALDKYLKDHKEINKIFVCTNNDEAGHNSYVNIVDKYSQIYTIDRMAPVTYDFNNDLTLSQGMDTKFKEFDDGFLKACSFDKLQILNQMDNLKIDKTVIETLVTEKKICLSQFGNLLFLGYDNKKVTNAYCKSIGDLDFEGYKEGSDLSAGFSVQGTNQNLYVFNDHIEMLSYMSLLKVNEVDFKGHLLTGGKEAVEEYTQKNGIKKVIFCMNEHEVTDYKCLEDKIMKIHSPKNYSFKNDITIIAQTEHVIEHAVEVE